MGLNGLEKRNGGENKIKEIFDGELGLTKNKDRKWDTEFKLEDDSSWFFYHYKLSTIVRYTKNVERGKLKLLNCYEELKEKYSIDSWLYEPPSGSTSDQIEDVRVMNINNMAYIFKRLQVFLQNESEKKQITEKEFENYKKNDDDDAILNTITEYQLEDLENRIQEVEEILRYIIDGEVRDDPKMVEARKNFAEKEARKNFAEGNNEY